MKEEFYDELSDLVNWHWWYKGRKSVVMRQLEKYSDAASDHDILDIGCGPGGMLNDLLRFGKVYGLDSSFKSIKICRKKGFSETFHSNVENLPFRDSSFSKVLMLDVLEHVNHDREVLHEAIRVCKPGGMILLTVPAFQFLWGDIDIVTHHKRRYTINDLKMLVSSGGVHVVKASYFNFILFPFIAAIRFMEKLTFRHKKSEGSIQSDFSFNKPGFVNDLLTGVFSLESGLLPILNFPVGVSILFILKKSL